MFKRRDLQLLINKDYMHVHYKNKFFKKIQSLKCDLGKGKVGQSLDLY